MPMCRWHRHLRYLFESFIHQFYIKLSKKNTGKHLDFVGCAQGKRHFLKYINHVKAPNMKPREGGGLSTQTYEVHFPL